jgi:hypothetical protein
MMCLDASSLPGVTSHLFVVEMDGLWLEPQRTSTSGCDGLGVSVSNCVSKTPIPTHTCNLDSTQCTLA